MVIPQLKLNINGNFYDINSNTITSFKSKRANDGGVAELWQKEFKTDMAYSGNDDKSIYVFDFENNNLLSINLNTGGIVQNISLLWTPNKITVKKEFLIVIILNGMKILLI